jgi:TonB family protein
MKQRIITPLLFLLLLTGFSQDLSYEVHGKYIHPVKKEKLDQANFMSDIIPYYPASWITSYVSAEILATSDGVEMTAAGINEMLTPEQKDILNSVDLGTDIVINISYKYKNPVTENLEDGRMNYKATVVPATEAEYSGGYQQMKEYIKENAINKIPGSTSEKFQTAIVEFTIDEEGEIANAQLSSTSGDQETDELLLDVINNMPKWRPAEDSNGMKVEQEFEFTVGNSGGC